MTSPFLRDDSHRLAPIPVPFQVINALSYTKGKDPPFLAEHSLEVSQPGQQQKDCCTTFPTGSCHSCHHQCRELKLHLCVGYRYSFVSFLLLGFMQLLELVFYLVWLFVFQEPTNTIYNVLLQCTDNELLAVRPFFFSFLLPVMYCSFSLH